MRPRIGVVAGGGDMPHDVIAACREQGHDAFVLALRDQAEPGSFRRRPDAWIRVGEIGLGMDLLRRAGATEIVFAGAVRRPSPSALCPDMRGAKLLAGLGRAYFRDGAVLAALAALLEEDGFVVRPPESVAPLLMAEARNYGPIAPDAAALADAARGFEVGRALGRLDVGQAVVVQNGAVLGVEAVEGTDALVARAGDLAFEGPRPVLVKTCKPGQDRRVDLPTIGPRTIRLAAGAGFAGVAVEAGAALIVDAGGTAELAGETGLFVAGMAPPDAA